MKSKPIVEAEPHELVEMVKQLQSKVQKKNQDLARTRKKLAGAKVRIQRLQGIVSYQRERILQLYN